MMDYDRRYTTYNQYRSIRFDPQYFLNQISIVAYKTKFVAPDISILHKFETYCTMWVGLFQMAAAQYHKNHTNLSEL